MVLFRGSLDPWTQGAVLHQDEEEGHKGTEFRSSGELQPAVFVLHDVGMV